MERILEGEIDGRIRRGIEGCRMRKQALSKFS
jgi:hypothetical protein